MRRDGKRRRRPPIAMDQEPMGCRETPKDCDKRWIDWVGTSMGYGRTLMGLGKRAIGFGETPMSCGRRQWIWKRRR